MGFLFKEAKIFHGITAVILFSLLVFTNTACGAEPDSTLSALFSTPNISTYTPPPPTATAVSTPTTPTNPVLNEAEPVRFTPGSMETTLKHELTANDSYTHTLYGLAGQVLAVNIVASHDEMVFTILDANNQVLAKSQGNKPLRVTLSEDGDCFIKVESPNENGSKYGYSMALSLARVSAAPSTPSVAAPSTIPSTLVPIFTPLPFVETAVIPQAEPITFTPRQTVVTKEGQVSSGTEKTYVISGMAGQELSIFVNASQPGVIVSVSALNTPLFPDFRSGEVFDEILPTTQDYFIQITPQANTTDLDYSLTLSLTTPESEISPEPITFNANGESDPLNGILYLDSVKTYEFSGSEGQNIIIDTLSNNSDFTISVHGADDILLGWTTSGIQFSAFLPTTQDYFITLMPSTDTQDLNYSIVVTVQ